MPFSLLQAAVHAVGDLAYRAMHSVAPELEEGEGEGTASARELAAPARVEEEGGEDTGGGSGSLLWRWPTQL